MRAAARGTSGAGCRVRNPPEKATRTVVAVTQCSHSEHIIAMADGGVSGCQGLGWCAGTRSCPCREGVARRRSEVRSSSGFRVRRWLCESARVRTRHRDAHSLSQRHPRSGLYCHRSCKWSGVTGGGTGWRKPGASSYRLCNLPLIHNCFEIKS